MKDGERTWNKCHLQVQRSTMLEKLIHVRGILKIKDHASIYL
jgi:hypothetical protein